MQSHPTAPGSTRACQRMSAHRLRFKPIPLLILSSTALVLGMGVYTLIRDPAMLYIGQRLGVPLRAVSPDHCGTLTFLLGSLPSAIHTFAFSLITAAVLGSSRYASGGACVFWAAMDCLFELLQYTHHCPSVFANSDRLLARVTCAYISNGTFDVMDMVFASAGSVLAYFVLSRVWRTAEDT